MPSGLALRLGECELREIFAERLSDPSSAALSLTRGARERAKPDEKGTETATTAVGPRSGGLRGQNSFRNNAKRRLGFSTVLLLLAYAERVWPYVTWGVATD